MQQPSARVTPAPGRRLPGGWLSFCLLALMVLSCGLTLPWTLAPADGTPHAPRWFEATNLDAALLPPFWAPHAADERQRISAAADLDGRAPRHLLGTDRLGRDVLARLLVGGAVSLGVGLFAAFIAVVIGTMYGAMAGWAGGRADSLLMRGVDVLYGLPSILLVVLLAIGVDGLLERTGADLRPAQRQMVNLLTLTVAIGAVSWLTMARVIRGQVLSLKARPFMEACRAIGVPLPRQFTHHLLPNLLGPITVYAALTVPTAILAESFLSFLGIGVREPVPSWGNLAAAGLDELNIVRSRWWLLLWPCLAIALTLLAMNAVGEGLRKRFDLAANTGAPRGSAKERLR